MGTVSDLVEQARNPDAGAFDGPAKYAAYLEGLCQELADEVEKLRGLLREARDDVAECMGQETKPHRIKANKVRLAAIDEAIGEGLVDIDDERANSGVADR